MSESYPLIFVLFNYLPLPSEAAGRKAVEILYNRG